MKLSMWWIIRAQKMMVEMYNFLVFWAVNGWPVGNNRWSSASRSAIRENFRSPNISKCGRRIDRLNKKTAAQLFSNARAVAFRVENRRNWAIAEIAPATLPDVDLKVIGVFHARRARKNRFYLTGKFDRSRLPLHGTRLWKSFFYCESC